MVLPSRQEGIILAVDGAVNLQSPDLTIAMRFRIQSFGGVLYGPIQVDAWPRSKRLAEQLEKIL